MAPGRDDEVALFLARTWSAARTADLPFGGDAISRGPCLCPLAAALMRQCGCSLLVPTARARPPSHRGQSVLPPCHGTPEHEAPGPRRGDEGDEGDLACAPKISPRRARCPSPALLEPWSRQDDPTRARSWELGGKARLEHGPRGNAPFPVGQDAETPCKLAGAAWQS